MKRKEHVKLVINGLMRIRNNPANIIDGYEQAVEAASAIFADDLYMCLWCKQPRPGNPVRDLDRFFCSNCCPICNGWPDERAE